MADLPASGTNPGTTYTISPPTDPGVYHEDRVVVTTVGATSTTQMFRVYGATLEADGWHFVGASTAYATVQNPDGSIHYFTYSGSAPWSTDSWEGSDNNTIYNAVDFGTTAGGSALDNSAALTALFTAMADATGDSGLGGGMARIPQYNFPVNAFTSLEGLALPPQSIIQAQGTGGFNNNIGNYHFSIHDAMEPGAFLGDTGSHTSGGVVLRNLAFQWVSPSYYQDTCLFFGSTNDTAEGCNFTDCPAAINFSGLAGSAVRCTVNYNVMGSPPANVTAFWINGEQNAILGPSELSGGGGSLTGTSACVGIGGSPSATEHNTIRGVHIFGWNYGIDYSDINATGIGSGTSNDVIDGCKIDCSNSCINLFPGSGGKIFNQTFANNEMTKSQDSNDGSPIVYIEKSAEGAAGDIGPTFLVNNVIYSNVTGGTGQVPPDAHRGMAQHNQYGVQIGTVDYVSILGGQISNCGTKGGSDGTANICISGNPNKVIVSNVDLNAQYVGANSGNSTGNAGAGPSQYALLISGNPEVVQVSNCSMEGFAGNQISVSGTPLSLIVTNCPGYNDQNTPVASGHMAGDYPTSTSGNTAATAGALTGGANYYGPSLVIFTVGSGAALSVYVNGVTSSYPANSVGTVFLNSPYDQFYFIGAVAPAHFNWIGK